MTEIPSPQGRTIETVDAATRAGAIELAFDYRGDVTIVRGNGGELTGYVADRRRGASEAGSIIRVMPADGGPRIEVPWSDVRAIRFSGRDPAAGRSFDTWVRRYLRKKLAGEEASLHPEPPDRP